MTPTPAGREPAGTAPGRQVALPYEAGFFPPLCWAPLLLSPPLASRRLSLPPAPSPHGSLWPYLPLGTSSWSPRLGSCKPPPSGLRDSHFQCLHKYHHTLEFPISISSRKQKTSLLIYSEKCNSQEPENDAPWPFRNSFPTKAG